MTTEMNIQQLTRKWGIALTGGIASGKSTIGRSLKARGFVVIDADQISRQVVLSGTEGLAEIVAKFGHEILTAEGELNRSKMRAIIFADAKKRQALEAIIHHRLSAASEEQLHKAGLFAAPRPWFYEASLIYERQREKDFAAVWVAYCPRETQIARVMDRDAIDRSQAEAILRAQMPPEEKVQRAELVLDTDCDPQELERRITLALASIEKGNYRE